MTTHAGFVDIDDALALEIDYSPNECILGIGPSFAALLDEFCTGHYDAAAVAHFRQVIKESNTDVAFLAPRGAINLGYSISVSVDRNACAADGAADDEQADASGCSSQRVARLSRDASHHSDAAPKACPAKRQWADDAGTGASIAGAEQLTEAEQAELCKAHKPPNKTRKDSAPYWFFNACRDGCLRCVQLLVDVHRVPKDIRSESGAYNGRDFVVDSASRKRIKLDEASEILTFLDDTAGGNQPRECSVAASTVA